MTKMLTGSWRRANGGQYKPFIGGIARLNGTTAEIISRDGNVTYIKVKDVLEKINGGYLYDFERIPRPNPKETKVNSIYNAYSGTSGRRFRRHSDTKPEASGHFAG